METENRWPVAGPSDHRWRSEDDGATSFCTRCGQFEWTADDLCRPVLHAALDKILMEDS